VVTKAHDGVRLLGQGELKTKLAFIVHHASKSAVAAVEKLGGSVKLLEARKPKETAQKQD
jgi:large subunit ribosomal protein L15